MRFPILKTDNCGRTIFTVIYIDISTIAIWLGHSSIETTHKYMIADMELKRKAMEKVGSAGNSSYKYKPSADIMNFLNSL